jgi:PAS domain S-box-containing protein
MPEKAELQGSVDELTRLLESSQDVFYRTDKEGRVTFVTPSIERYAGYTPGELIGRYAHEVYAEPADRHKFLEEIRRTGTVIDYGVRLVDRSGEIHFASVNARVLYENGKFAGVEGVMRDITRRRRLELHVAESEQLFRNLAQSAPVGIFLSDEQENCTFVNPKWCELAGMTSEEATGKGWLKAIHPDDRERVFHERQAARSQERDFEIDCRFQTPQGKVSITRASAIILKDSKGRFTGYLGTITDLTGIHRAEQVTRNLGSIIESFHDAIVVFTLDGVILHWNKAAERIYGYTAGEVIGRHTEALNLAANHWQQIEVILDRLLLGQILAPVYGSRRRKDGKVIYVSVTFSIVRDISGAPIGATAVVRDITQRKIELDALQRSEEIFRAVFDRGTVGIAMIGADLRFSRVNPTLLKILGRSESELIGMKISDVTHPDDVEKVSQLALSLFRSEIPYYRLEKRYLHKSGSVVWARLTATAIPNSEGVPEFGLAMIEDISDSKKYEQERESIIEQLQEALANVKTLSGLLPMCSWCKKIRDEHGVWSEIEVYIQQRSDADITHGICTECQNKIRKDLGLELK